MTSSRVPTALREFAEVIGADHVRCGAASDAIDGVQPTLVVGPATPSEVARVLAMANKHKVSVIPRGGGTKLGWGNAPRSADIVLSLRRLDQVLEHAAGDMTVTVEAGCTIAGLQAKLAERGQRLALDPLWPDRATIGGVLATADCGSLRWRYGSPRDHVLGVTVALADGTLARSGGKVVKNVAGYDLPKLFTGSFGTLGIITQATFRLHPVPAAARQLVFLITSEGIGEFVKAMRDCSLVTSAVTICAAEDVVSARVLVEGLHEALESKLNRVTNSAIAAGAALSDTAGDSSLHREQLFDDHGPPFVVAKVSVLPAQLESVASAMRTVAPQFRRWRAVMQGTGIALVRLECLDVGTLVAQISRLRSAIIELGGSLVVLRCPPEQKNGLDVWGEPGNSLPLMKRVKNQFDPMGILNPGRFVGGI